MNSLSKIGPGIGRRRYWLPDGRYSVIKLIPVLEELVAGARHCYIKVQFRNGSAQVIPGPQSLTAVANFREVKYVFVHAAYPDGSTVTGKPVNSPISGYLFFDEWPNGKKPKAPTGGLTTSCERGNSFKEQWEPTALSARAAVKRTLKYVSALLAVATVFWAFGSGILMMVASWVGIEVPPKGQRPQISTAGAYTLYIGTASLVFHLFRFEKFAATRVYRPLIGPSVKRFKGWIAEVMRNKGALARTVLATFIAPLLAGLIVLYAEKVLWK